jgi:alpha-N-arabinofuranosidase
MIAKRIGIFFVFELMLIFTLHVTDCIGNSEQNAPVSDVLVTVDAGDIKGDISEMLTGVNMSYYYDNDKIWDDGKIAEYLREVKSGILRYPGGVETSRFHWENPEVNWYMDGWDPLIQGKQDHSGGDAYMDTDDFIRQCRAIGAEPLIGINIQCGVRFNRIADSVKEAASWVKYCKDKNYNVKYWYLDNETYWGSNVGPITIEQYVGYIKQFVPAIREVDSNIKIVADWQSLLGDPHSWTEYEYLISEANEYIDIIDVHFYWAWGYCTWDMWLKDNPMKVRQWCRDCPDQRYIGPSFAEEIRGFHKKVEAMGANIKLASLEWNIAPNRNAQFSRFQQALMQAEMLGQFIEGGLQMACMWPLTWTRGDLFGDFRTILDQENHEPTPSFYVFKLYSNVIGQKLIASHANQNYISPLSAISKEGKTLWAYLLNKSGDKQAFDTVVDISGFDASGAKAVVFTSQDLSCNVCEVKDIVVNQNSKTGKWQITLPPYSLTMLTFYRQN